ncbi:MAG: 50S ribosomal protein L13 [Deltaproteobacteria bacterium]|nr:50S ribosomal protein L13 [Deltaproteobacteria bacterium]
MSLTKQTASLQKDQVVHQWYVVDLDGAVLGRAAVRMANMLRGKDRPSFTPNADCGDYVVVINAAKATLTGKKMEAKMYHRHTGFPGGIKSEPARIYLSRKSERAVRLAVWGMLPKGALGRRLITKLKVYAGPNHPHAAQNPIALPV